MKGTLANFARLDGIKMPNSDLRSAHFIKSDLTGADLTGSNLTDAKLRETALDRSNLTGVCLCGADLTAATLRQSLLIRSDLRNAVLDQATLEQAVVVDSILEGALIRDCLVHGLSAWGTKGLPSFQIGLVITRTDQPRITVDDLELAQFIYLLMDNKKLRRVIDTITSKVVLILGRFIPGRKEILDSLRSELPKHNLTPILFDFNGPQNRDVIETVSLLASMSRFVLVDVTEPHSVPHELALIAPDLAIPIQPIIQSEAATWSMLEDLQRKYDWVLDTHKYVDEAHLLSELDGLIAVVENKRNDLIRARLRLET